MTAPAAAAGSSDRFGTGVLAGVGLGLLLHVVVIPIAVLVIFVASNEGPRDLQDVALAIFLFGALFIGVAQLVYMLPAIAIAALTRHRGVAIGLVIVTALGFLLNAACWSITLGIRGLDLLTPLGPRFP